MGRTQRKGAMHRIGAMVVSVALGLGSAAQAETLADALAGAYNHSGLLEQNRAVLRAADEDVAIALSSLRPVINWSGSATRRYTSIGENLIGGTVDTRATTAVTVNLIAEYLLFDFGQTQLGLDAAKETVLATRAGLVAVEQQVLFRAVQAYMEVRRAIQFVNLRQSNTRLISQELRAARDRFEVGEVTRTDVSLAEARLAAARSNLAAAQGDLEIAIEEYLAVVGRRPGNLVPPSGLPKLAASEEAAKATAVRIHPSINEAQHQIAAAELLVLRARAAMQPTVSLSGQLSVGSNTGSSVYDRNASVGIQAGGPIYQGGRLSALLRKAMAQRDAQRSSLHVVRHEVQQNVGNAYARLLVARARIEASQRQIRAARTAFQGVREEATLGARTTLDVLDAEQELLDAQAQLISAQVDQYIAAYNVLAAMGLLTADYLKLGVQQYDPAEYYNLVKNAPTISQQGQKLDRVLRALGKE